MSYIKLEKITHQYKNGQGKVLNQFDLSIEKGELIVIVGPSGSGKSTLLELICGFEKLSEGSIFIDGECINGFEPKERDVAMVFQNYAVFPHLTVYENIEFGMKIRKVKKKQRDQKVMWAAKLLQLEPFLDKLPSKLSGGQRQRVALARAMVRNPKLFLMDEPLSNLDLKLKETLIQAIINLHKELNATMIYVTHDQVEAMTLADRIVILKDGCIQQIGTPSDIYEHPANEFVATFIGKPQINLVDFVCDEETMCLDNQLVLPVEEAFKKLDKGTVYRLGIRPEHVTICSDDHGILATVAQVEYLGGEIVLHVLVSGITLVVKMLNGKRFTEGESIYIRFDLSRASVFDIKTQKCIWRLV